MKHFKWDQMTRKSKAIGISLMSVLALSSCGESGSDLKVIKGKDTRTELSKESDYHQSVGAFGDDTGYYCTAYASSLNTVVTASHCVSRGKEYSIKLGEKTYRLVLDSVSEQSKEAHLSLKDANESLPDFIIKATSEKGEDLSKVSLVSFDQKRQKLVESSESGEVFYEAGLLMYSLDSLPGSSGSPVLNEKGEYVGTHLGAVIHENEVMNVSSFYSEEIAENIRVFEECWDYNPFCSSKSRSVTICKKAITVNALFYAACQASLSAIPATCTVGTAVTAGTSCWANMGVSAAACGVSIESIITLGRACVSEMSN